MFEIGSVPHINNTALMGVSGRRGIIVPNDATEFDKEREFFKTAARSLFLVHKLSLSQDFVQVYDVLIYLLPSMKFGTLARVKHVDSYFGKYWGGNVFRSTGRETGFIIGTSAYGPITCTAKVMFIDKTHILSPSTHCTTWTGTHGRGGL